MDKSGTGKAPTGWALVVSRDDLDLAGVLARFGSVFRVPIGATDGAQMAPGQPCVLWRTDRSATVGIWAIGEVVAPVLELGPDDPLLPGESVLRADARVPAPRRYAEVELHALAKPISRDRVAADPTLATTMLAATPPRGAVPLSRDAVRAIEALDFWLEEPDDDQRDRLDRLLAEEDELLG